MAGLGLGQRYSFPCRIGQWRPTSREEGLMKEGRKVGHSKRFFIVPKCGQPALHEPRTHLWVLCPTPPPTSPPLLYLHQRSLVGYFLFFAGAENSDRGRQGQEDPYPGGAESDEAAHRRQEPPHNPRGLPPAACARIHRAGCVHEPSAVYDDGYLLRGTSRGGESG